MNNMDYEQFLQSKLRKPKFPGIDYYDDLPSSLKHFQRDIVIWALRMGRCAIFAGTGLGKTLTQLSWAHAISQTCGGMVLILTPLAVAQQTVREAAKFGIPSVNYAEDQHSIKSDIVVTNYDRMEKFDFSQFKAIVLDESSIIKAQTSKTRTLLMELSADIPYKLCCTATPAPNDFVELGNHSEFLGVMTAKEMLATYFVHDGSIRAGDNASGDGWRLKRHAENEFWKWVSSWSVMLSHPRDLGYNDDGYDLPPLIKHQITVKEDYAPCMETGTLFPMQASTLQERRGAARSSIYKRAQAAVDIINQNHDDHWLIWCQLNNEADAIKALLPDIVEVRGSDKPEDKSKKMLGFADGDIKRLVTKPKIAGFGMNWQICRNMIFLGLNDSFEQTFQAIRRCWRFGQSHPVNVYMIASELEGAVVSNLERKEDAYQHMMAQMIKHTQGFSKMALSDNVVKEIETSSVSISVPSWLN